MLRSVAVFCLILLSPAAGHAADASQCLPKTLFAMDPDTVLEPRLRLGFARGVPTVCVPTNADRTEFKTCFAVDAGTGALSASAATRLMGRSTPAVPIGPSGCIENYCVTPKPDADASALFAISTDEAHAVIHVTNALHVFDAKTKVRTATIPIRDEKAPEDTNIGLEPQAIFYLGHTLFVVGAAAGPFKAVWLYGDDGKRLGSVKDPQLPRAGEEMFSVYLGAANIIDDTHVAVANAGLRTMQIFDDAGRKADIIRRAVTLAPCTADDILDVDIDAAALPAKCKAHAKKVFAPLFDAEPVRLPNGDLLTALSGRYLGQLAVLDGKTLMEKRRMTLRRCGG